MRPGVVPGALAALVAGATLVAGCSAPARPGPTVARLAPGGGARSAPGGGARSAPSTAAASSAGQAASTGAPGTTTAAPSPAQAGWAVLSTVPSGVAVDQRRLTLADGSAVTILRFRAGQVRYALHVGSQDPPTNGVPLGPQAQSAIGAAEQGQLLAAFNGGFETSTGAGGFEVDGRILTPLRPGLASLVIDASGSARVGVWGQDVPAPGEQVQSVRQNLVPLVASGQASPQVGDVAAWGATLGGGPAVARSALGQDSQGDLLYAASMAALPADLADALVQVGATTAMELDINPEWVQADTAPTPGAPLVAAVPGQHRPADQYQQGWTRDFVTVLAGAGG